MTLDMGDDGLPEDRITCETCRKCEVARVVPFCTTFKAHTIVTLKRRCIHYEPIRSVADQRTGAERYPGIQREIEELRAIERGYVITEHKERDPKVLEKLGRAELAKGESRGR